jgi:hypothetical protein
MPNKRRFKSKTSDKSFVAIQDAVEVRIKNHSIGFVKLGNAKDGADAWPAGSGTLVKLASLEGILTAAHVLEQFADGEKIGLVRFPIRSTRLQGQTVKIRTTDMLKIGRPPWRRTGPDIAFLRLYGDSLGYLRATASFVNLNLRRTIRALSKLATRPYFDVVAGVIAERTSERVRPPIRTKEIEALLTPGRITDRRLSKGYDLLRFTIPGRPETTSHRGTSGGGLWRVSLENDHGQPRLRELSFYGVPFWESSRMGPRILTCHGPRSIYRRLLLQAARRWPEGSTPLLVMEC